MENLTKRLVDMQFQLQEAIENNETDQFIYDHADDLNKLLLDSMWLTTKREVANREQSQRSA